MPLARCQHWMEAHKSIRCLDKLAIALVRTVRALARRAAALPYHIAPATPSRLLARLLRALADRAEHLDRADVP